LKFSGDGTISFTMYLSGFIVSEKKMVPIILTALRAHHTPNWMSCKSTACIRLGLSADQCHVTVIVYVTF